MIERVVVAAIGITSAAAIGVAGWHAVHAWAAAAGAWAAAIQSWM